MGAVPVCFGVPLVEGICYLCGVCTAGDGLHGVFVVAAEAVCCGVAGATDAAGGFADGACSKDSGVLGATSAVVDVPCFDSICTRYEPWSALRMILAGSQRLLSLLKTDKVCPAYSGYLVLQ